MRISHVIRGEDHLSNTPKHIQLYRALGIAPPRFAHIPLILNRDGSKMSKRDRGASLGGYMELGYSPEAVRNYLCLLGWSPKDNREKLDIGEVVRLFDLKNVNRKNAAFDLDKCTWLSGEYLREMDGETFEQRAREALARAGIDMAKFPPEYVHAAIETCCGKLKIFSEMPAYAGFYFGSEVTYDPEAARKQFTPENRPRVEAVRAAFAALEDFSAAAVEAALKSTAAALGVKVGVLVHPTRLALTGAASGPSLYHLIEVLGKGEVLRRIDRALEQYP
jgi:glutamyl-tRNA synthetase